MKEKEKGQKKREKEKEGGYKRKEKRKNIFIQNLIF